MIGDLLAPVLGKIVAAHELTHQWWGNPVIPADMLGAKMLTESLAEYTALKVLEKEYGTSLDKIPHYAISEIS